MPVAGPPDLPDRLGSLVRSTPWLLEALAAARDAEVERALAERLPGVPWDAKNQAAVHTWYGRVFGGQVAPLTSAADGLEDLFNLICRRNPRRVTVDHYRRRVRDKRIAGRWPRVEILGC